MVWSQSDHVEQKLQPAGLIELVVVVEVELYSSDVQWVQIMVGVVEVKLCSPAVLWVQMMVVVVEVDRVMRGAPRNWQWLGLMPINPLSQSQYSIPERFHGIGNLS